MRKSQELPTYPANYQRTATYCGGKRYFLKSPFKHNASFSAMFIFKNQERGRINGPRAWEFTLPGTKNKDVKPVFKCPCFLQRNIILLLSSFQEILSPQWFLFQSQRAEILQKKKEKKPLAFSERSPSNTGSYFAGRGRTYLKQEERSSWTRFN